MEYILESAKFELLKAYAEKLNSKFNEQVVAVNETSASYETINDSTIKLVKFDISFSAAVGDWQVIAKKRLEGNVILVDNYSDKPLAIDFRNNDFHCDHCHTSRAKKNLYLIKNSKTNEYKKVGEACLKEFTGASINRFFSEEKAYANVLLEADRIKNLDVSSDSYISTVEYIAHVHELAKTEEYVNKNLANYEHIPTSHDIVMDSMKKPASEENISAAKEIIKWFVESSKNTDQEFIKNASAIISQEYLNTKLASRVTFVAFNYKKHLKRLAEKAAREAIAAQMIDDYLPGNIKDRVTLNLKLLKYTAFEREQMYYYDSGISYIYTFIDEKGRVIVWKTTNGKFANDDCLNKIALVTGTIKDFSEYREQKQTVLTRCRVKFA